MLIDHQKLDERDEEHPALGRYRTAVRKEIPAVIAISAAVNILLLTSSVYMLQVLDRVLASGSTETLIYLTIIALVALGVYGGLEYNRRQILTRVGAFTDHQLTPAIFSQMIQRGALGDRRFNSALTGATNIRSFLSGDNALAFADAPWTPIFLIAIALIHPALGLIALAGIVILFGITLLHDRIARPISQQERKEINQINVRGNEAVMAADTIQAIGMRPAIVDSFRANFDARLPGQVKGRDALSAWLALSRYFRFALQIAILGAGAALAIAGATTAGGMIAASILLTRAVAPVERSLTAWQSMIHARSGWEEIKALFRLPDGDRAQLAMPDPEGVLEFKDVAVVQPGRDQFLFHSLSGEVSPGSVLIIIGPSGSGKSTLARLMLGVGAPSRGRITLDGTSAAQWPSEELGRFIGYLPQTVDILTGTVAENIARFGIVEENAVVTAAREAGIHEWVSSLPLGYQTRIGPEGRRLSGGQLQRIALARALYGAPHLIVLDEPTSGQDQVGIAALVEATVAARARGAIVVLITHNADLVNLGDFFVSLKSSQAQFYQLDKDAKPTLVHDASRKLSPQRRRALQHTGTASTHTEDAQEENHSEQEPDSAENWKTHTSFEHTRKQNLSQGQTQSSQRSRTQGREDQFLRSRTLTDRQDKH